MKKTYQIHEVGEELKIHESTIRRLEKRGLIHPSRTLTGHRIFTEEDISKIREIYESKKS
jgi:DNA-binding transcriptional MerR regulator